MPMFKNLYLQLEIIIKPNRAGGGLPKSIMTHGNSSWNAITVVYLLSEIINKRIHHHQNPAMTIIIDWPKSCEKCMRKCWYKSSWRIKGSISLDDCPWMTCFSNLAGASYYFKCRNIEFHRGGIKQSYLSLSLLHHCLPWHAMPWYRKQSRECGITCVMARPSSASPADGENRGRLLRRLWW